ncbi:MAG: hypothetical protein M1830_010002 [Pleopsidium flavum]|nr:MAG: hypothetical protein M1830_010002 [Pleopsidium flavum]
MATAARVQLSLKDCGEFHLPGVTADSAAKGSEVLQDNHENHHIFFNRGGFHNHIAHHTLTLYALAASPAVIQKHYENNKSYQRPPGPLEKRVVQDLYDPCKFHDYLGDEKYYHDFLVFFQQEIDKRGCEDVINEYVLKRDDRADDLLARMFAGFLHPLIHLGFGVEFKQPAIIAEALAQAAVHDVWIGPFLFEAEKAAHDKASSKSMVSILDEIRADNKLSTAAHWDDGNKIRDGILKRAPDEMIKYASQWTVVPDQLEEKTAEMIDAAGIFDLLKLLSCVLTFLVYYTGGAQHPPKQIKFDFYYMHCVNSSIFFSAFLKQPWISQQNKVRLLEWKGRLDLCMFASRRSPKPLLDEITNYKPKEQTKEGDDPWQGIFQRAKEHNDDGHLGKLVRALAHGEQVCRPYEDRESFRIKGKMWSQLGHMAIDSVEDTGDAWVRSAGFDEAWSKYEDRPRAQL